MTTPLPSENEQWIQTIMDAVVSDLQRIGMLDTINRSEPKSKPGTGITGAVWMQRLRPLARGSGLSHTTAVLVLTIRLYKNMMATPSDEIDPVMMEVVSRIFREFHDDYDFGLDPLVRNVDVFGEVSGFMLEEESGYLEIDKTNFRTMDIVVPIIVNDVWEQINA